MAAVSAVAYIILGTIGYKKFKGKVSPVGAVIIIIAGLIMVAVGVTIAYSVAILREMSKELEIINFNMLADVLKIIFKAIFGMPEVRKELITNIVISYTVSGFYFVLQLRQMVKEWKNQKSIHKPREI
jgi:sulfite exporter TauE/SafE